MKKDGFSAAIPEIERRIGYKFRDKSLLRQAFTRSSWCNEHPSEGYQSNEVLEFFGDGVLSVAIISFLLSESTERCERGIHTSLGEGDFSNIKSKLSDKTNLSVSTAKLGLEQYLLVGEGDSKLGIRSEPSVMEDLFESIVGAVYIDSDNDVKMVTKVVTTMLDMSVYADSSAASVSPKNALQEWCADKKRRLPPPIYKTVSEDGPDHKKEYVRGVYVGARLLATAKGKNQKSADALAAKEALRVLMDEAARKDTDPEKKQRSDSKPAPAAREQQGAGADADRERKKLKTDKKPTSEQKQTTHEQKQAPASKQKQTTYEQKQAPASKQKQSAHGQKQGSIPEQSGKAAKAPRAAAEKKSTNAKRKTEGQPSSDDTARKTGIVAKQHGGKAESASARLRAYAARASVAGPVFRDLGLIAEDEHSVECSFMGQRAIATAPTRPEAKERAAESIIYALKLK